MPVVPQIIERHRRQQAGESDVLPEEEKLYFPSDLAGDDLDLCSPGIAEIEERLREGQMHDALNRLRIYLHIKTSMLSFKDRNLRNQLATTRAQALIHENEDKIWAAAAKYRKARIAKVTIAGHGEWEKKWRVLNDTDVRTMADEPTVKDLMNADQPEPTSSTSRKVTEGRRKATWIWMAADATEGGVNYDDGQSLCISHRYPIILPLL